MKNREIEAKLKRSVSAAAPDVLQQVISDCKEQKGRVVYMEKTKKKRSIAARIAAVAAAFVVIAAGVTGFQIYRTNYRVASVVELDVNPSIEIQVNGKEKVIDVIGRNKDGQTVIGNMDFKGSGLDVTVNALIGSMLRNGYLSELANSILISVDNDDAAKGADLERRLAAEINEILQSNTFEGAVLSQQISDNADLKKLAEQYDITVGKAQLIQQIAAKNPLYNFADLTTLSINELNLLRANLSDSGDGALDSVNAIGNASDKAYLDEAAVKKVVFAHADVKEADVRGFRMELDYEHGLLVYEVEFYAGNYEYDYDVDAVNGTIISNDKEWEETGVLPIPETGQDKTPGQQPTEQLTEQKDTQGQQPTQQQTQRQTQQQTQRQTQKPAATAIDQAKAKAIAFAHAGVTENQASLVKAKLDYDDGIQKYEIEFYAGNYEYDYEINAADGSILKHEKELKRQQQTQRQTQQVTQQSSQAQQPVTGSQNQNGSQTTVSREQAKATALSHAGLTENQIREYECELDFDDGVKKYEIDFKSGNYEYSYDINATTGSIIKFEKEYDD